MNLSDLLNKTREIAKQHPDKIAELQELYELAYTEIEEGGDEAHECELAISAMKDLINE